MMRHAFVCGLLAMGLCSSAGQALCEEVHNWSGIHAGVEGGFGWGVSDPTTPGTPTQYPAGLLAGLQGGADYQFQNGVVLGLAGDISFSDVSSIVHDGGPFLVESGKMEDFGTLRLRAGYANGNFLPYVTGGAAWLRGRASIGCTSGASFGVCSVLAGVSASDSRTATGWVIGAGVEDAFAPHWTADVQYLYADLGTNTFNLGVFGSGDIKMSTSILTAGVNYHF